MTDDDELKTPDPGFLPIHTNAFDRIFIGIVVFVALHLFWMRFLEALGIVWISTAISVVLGCLTSRGRIGHEIALVLEEKLHLSLRDFPIDEPLGRRDVRIALQTVGICGSDVHYYTHGSIGPFVVNAPMILGHEASGIVIEVGADVDELSTRRPGLHGAGHSRSHSRASRLGKYNLDPAVRFWATPPVHGILRPTVVHPADFTFKLPDNVSFAAAAMVEPLAVGMHGATKARITPGRCRTFGARADRPGDALSALAGGCARVFITDIDDAKLEIAGRLGAITPINVMRETWRTACCARLTAGASKSSSRPPATPRRPLRSLTTLSRRMRCDDRRPDGAGHLQCRRGHGARSAGRELFRYAHVFPRCVAMLASGAIDVKPLITRNFAFEDSVHAFEVAASAPKGDVKMQVELPQ